MGRLRVRLIGAALLIGLVALPALGDDDALLRRAFGAFMRSADELRIEAIPDLYDGGYARITAIGRGVHVVNSPRIDEAMIRLVGVSLDPAALRAGTLKVLDYRDSALHVRVQLRSVQEFFNAGSALEDIRLWSENGYLLGTGTVIFQGRPTRLRMKGFFAVSGTTEVYFYFDTLHANGIPVLTVIIRDLERQINPILHQRDWPVTFRIRSLRLDAQGLTISSQGDGTCPTCGGGAQPTYAP
ncbi:MAG: hypothetical protein HY355_02760 [Armatimonadetes bacterium]|nr:hypothetical protein [Armatimonadota bacterium]